MFRTTLAAALGALSVFAVASDSEKDVEKLLSSMRTAYSSVQSASLQSQTRVEIDGKEETQAVSMDYEKPNLLHLEFTFRGHTITRVSDGKKVYTMGEKGDPFTIKYSVEALGGDAPINLEAMCFFDWKRQLSTASGANMEMSKFKVIPSETWNDKSWIVLEETAVGQNVFVRYFVDPRTYYIWRCSVESLDRKRFIMETEVKKLLINPKLDPKLFQAPKKGG